MNKRIENKLGIRIGIGKTNYWDEYGKKLQLTLNF